MIGLVVAIYSNWDTPVIRSSKLINEREYKTFEMFSLIIQRSIFILFRFYLTRSYQHTFSMSLEMISIRYNLDHIVRKQKLCLLYANNKGAD